LRCRAATTLRNNRDYKDVDISLSANPDIPSTVCFNTQPQL